MHCLILHYFCVQCVLHHQFFSHHLSTSQFSLLYWQCSKFSLFYWYCQFSPLLTMQQVISPLITMQLPLFLCCYWQQALERQLFPSMLYSFLSLTSDISFFSSSVTLWLLSNILSQPPLCFFLAFLSFSSSLLLTYYLFPFLLGVL